MSDLNRDYTLNTEGIDLPGRLEVALGRNGRGVVVWDDEFGDTVRAVRVNARRLLRRR